MVLQTARTRGGGAAASPMRPWVQLVSLMAMWAVPVVAVAVVVPAAISREEASVTAPLPAVVQVGSQSTDYRTSVTATVELTQGGQARSSVAGLLTSLAEVDGPIRSGEQLFSVDGVPVVAQVGTAPFYRELREGDRGTDVENLGRFLVEAGLLSGGLADDKFGQGMREGVAKLQANLGLSADGVFRPAYVTFLPSSVTELGDPLLAVGSAVGPGDAIFDTAPSPRGIQFAATSSDASLNRLAEASLTLSFGELRIPVSGLEPTADETAAIYSAMNGAVTSGDAQLAASEPGEPQQFEGGLLSTAEPELRGTAPGTAVLVSDSGAQCLFRRQADDTSWELVKLDSLEPAVGVLGAVYVDIELIDLPIARDALGLPNEVREACR